MAVMKKPIVVDKIHKYTRQVRKNGNQVGTLPRSMTINYNNLCNFRCNFCYSSEASHVHAAACLDFATIKSVADQAHELGIWEMVLLGGELLINIDRFLQLMEAIGPERFQMVLITNGYLLSKETAKLLAEHGLDCVGVSVSTMNAEEHNASRGGVRDAHKRALEALDNAAEAGMSAWPNLIFGHHNAHSQDLFQFLDYVKARGYTTYLIMAMPFGVWKDSFMDAEDLQILNRIRKEYDCCFDTWDMYDLKRERISGCWTVNRTYLTPLGDVLACPYMNIKIGNVKEQALADILRFGFSIKYFGEYSPICISAHHRKFREKFLKEDSTIFQPLDASELFGEEDYIKETS